MTGSKKIDDDFISANYDVIFFFRFMADLEQSGRRILDAWFVIITFSLITIFCLTKTENITKRSLT